MGRLLDRRMGILLILIFSLCGGLALAITVVVVGWRGQVDLYARG
jgi:hypothetical protein